MAQVRWTISFDVTAPADVTRAQLEEWLAYHINGGSMDGQLADYLGDVADRATSRPFVQRHTADEALRGAKEGG